MNKVMFSQFKPMFIILAVFMVFSAIIAQIDPTVKDDIRLNLTDDGKGCDRIAGDGVFSACYTLDPSNTNYGKWTVIAQAYENGTQQSKQESYFLYNPSPNNTDTYVDMGTGVYMNVTTDKQVYMPGDTVRIYVTPANMTQGSSILFIPTAPPQPFTPDPFR